MAIVIGAATKANLGGYSCIISANWGFNPNVQRLYCIGEWTPDASRTFYKPTETLNLTLYSSSGTPTYSTTPSTSCDGVNTITASVSAATCGGDSTNLNGDWLVTSYSYSKDDATMPGQESWSLTRWVDGGMYTGPTAVLRGITEGQGTSNAGLDFDGTTTETSTGSVSAGGFGKADVLRVGVVVQVGGGSSAAGETGQGSASIPYTPLYF